MPGRTNQGARPKRGNPTKYPTPLSAPAGKVGARMKLVPGGMIV